MSKAISGIDFRHGLSEHPRHGHCHMVGVGIHPVEGESVEIPVTFDNMDAKHVAETFRLVAKAIDDWDAA